MNDRHSVSDSLESSQKRYSFMGLQHPSSSAIYKQASVHARLFILQEQLRLHSENVQRHVVSSLIPEGAGVLSSELEPACYCPTSIHFLLARGHSEVTLELCCKQKLESLLSQYDDDKDILMWEEGPYSLDSSGKKRKYRASSAFTQLFPDAQIEQMKDSVISFTFSCREELSPSLLRSPCI